MSPRNVYYLHQYVLYSNCIVVDPMLNVCIFFAYRWKQHDAYVQVLEAKYADLNCKSALVSGNERMQMSN